MDTDTYAFLGACAVWLLLLVVMLAIRFPRELKKKPGPNLLTRDEILQGYRLSAHGAFLALLFVPIPLSILVGFRFAGGGGRLDVLLVDGRYSPALPTRFLTHCVVVARCHSVEVPEQATPTSRTSRQLQDMVAPPFKPRTPWPIRHRVTLLAILAGRVLRAHGGGIK